MHEEEHLHKQPTLRVQTRPNDANAAGDIFGGWLMSKIDIACALEAQQRAKGHVATVAVKELVFCKPIFVYDLVSFYTNLEKVGNTSLTISVEVYARRMQKSGEYETLQVATATLVFVAISTPGHSRPVPK